MPHAALNELTPEQCRTHLSVGGVGRLVFATARGPVALPVNFEFTEGQIVFSTDDREGVGARFRGRRSASRSTGSTRP